METECTRNDVVFLKTRVPPSFPDDVTIRKLLFKYIRISFLYYSYFYKLKKRAVFIILFDTSTAIRKQIR